MKIIDPHYEILTNFSTDGVEELQLIEKACRTCYKSEERITEDGSSAKKMVSFLRDHAHEAPIEFSFAAVKFVCDRGISHEIVRHRLFSFAQESTRYCNYSHGKFDAEISVVRPTMLDESSEAYRIWREACEEAERAYFELLAEGTAPEIARDVLPTSLKTELNVGGNYREWRHFFKLRCAPDAHPQIRELAIPLLEEFKERIPVVFDDIEY